MSESIILDGTWDFLHTSGRSKSLMEVRKAEVPGPWQAQFGDLRQKSGIGIYRRYFDVPEGWKKDRIYLRFGAVFHNSRVWLNDKLIGTNEGGFLPFAFDVTDVVNVGSNEIKVRVESPTDDADAHPDTPLGEIPFGKQSWYGPLSGIWQSVCLETRDPYHVAGLHLTPLLGERRLDLKVELAKRACPRIRLAIEIVDADGSRVASLEQAWPAASKELALSIPLGSCTAWSPDNPHLYQVRVAIRRDGRTLDTVERACGFRTFTSRGGKFFLNGQPLHLRAALDQDYYPDTICTAPSGHMIEDQLRKAKELGLNCIRLHIKVADPRYLDAADRLGLLIWAELPNGGVSTERSRNRKEALLKGMVDRDAHHPSIVVWTIINENWGVDLVHDETHRTWLKCTYDWLKAYDPLRLVVDNSPLHPSFHIKSDIADYHFYASIPDSRAAWNGFVDQLAVRGGFLYGPPEECELTGEEPLLCSEFGNWGLPDPQLLANSDGSEPWWFETGHDWGGGVMYPHGIEHRFHDWHLDRVFGTLQDLVTATQWHQATALKYEIERMRLKPELAGYVITELTDVHWEANGLLDMRRNPKAFHGVFRHFNGDTVIVADVTRWAFRGGQQCRVPLSIIHDGPHPLAHLRLEVRIGDALATTVEVADLQPGGRTSLTLDLEMPLVAHERIMQISYILSAGDTEVARSWTDVSVLPARRDASSLRVWTADETVARHTAAMGYALAKEADEADVVIARGNPAALADLVRRGKRLLLLAEEPMPLYPFFPHWQNVNVEARAGTPWQGDWASAFSWLHRGKAFAGLPGGPLLDLSFDRVIPQHVVSGCNQHDFHGRVHAGIFVGWLHKSAALVVERPYGKGRVVASTFQLFRDLPGDDPIASALLDGLLTLASARRPGMSLPLDGELVAESGLAALHAEADDLLLAMLPSR
jgi:hypothetical protein